MNQLEEQLKSTLQGKDSAFRAGVRHERERIMSIILRERVDNDKFKESVKYDANQITRRIMNQIQEGVE